MTNAVTKTKISLSTFEPKKNLKDIDAGPVHLGILIGRVSRKTTREMPNGETFEGLGGQFRAVIGDPKAGNSVASGMCYMPEAFMIPILDALKEAGDGATIDFAYKVAIVKDGNPQGYTWALTDMVPAKAVDPLDALMAQANKAQAVEDKTEKK